MSRARWNGRSGFGLPTTILLLIVFALLGLVGLSLARQELRSQVRSTSRESAFYAAEVGLAMGMQKWSKPAGVYPPGTTWLIDQASLSGGSSYRVDGKLLDDRGIHVLYSVEAEGRSRDGRTQRVGFLVTTMTVNVPFNAALEVLDSVRLAGTADVVGFDQIPASWLGPYCSMTGDDMAGILMEDMTEFKKEGAAKFKGNPPLGELSDTTDFFDFTDLTFEEVAEQANITLNAGETVAGSIPAPAYNADGSCDTSAKYNWGDPKNPGQPCSNWFPIIYAKGDLRLESKKFAQGILLVDGDLSAKGGFEFYGPVFVKGELVSEGNFTFYGGVKAAKVDLGSGRAEIFYSHCVLQRALSHAGVARPRPLTERPWYHRR